MMAKPIRALESHYPVIEFFFIAAQLARALCYKSHFSVSGFMSHEDTYEPILIRGAKISKTMALCSNGTQFSQEFS